MVVAIRGDLKGSSPSKVFCKKGVLKNFATFIGKDDFQRKTERRNDYYFSLLSFS